ncbi:MAG TPA: pantoate--beta-alanine ligase [Bacteroidia bacterium]|nr:pantoate--beta-alanine ligase [Bacteroidia bacterium]
MILADTITRLTAILNKASQVGAAVGFVPTMGALHEGHISLINRAKSENEWVVSSIFVNPTQFNDPKDLLNYPRTPESDYAVLENAGCDIVFIPSVHEMYPSDALIDMDFGDLERVMEGQYRPGHFRGMATVVSRFFEIVKPKRAYFGEKDFQQLAIIREMNRRNGSGIEIVGCPTLREKDGLAMSSRNIHLTEAERMEAPIIYEALLYGAEAIRNETVSAVKKKVVAMIESRGGFRVQYLEFVFSDTLQPISKLDRNTHQRACVAVLTSKTRLIDNVPL